MVESHFGKLWLRIGLWSCGWSIFIAGVGALLVFGSIRDAHFRAELAVKGTRETAIVTDKLCGKSGNPEFRLLQQSRDGCAAEDYLPRYIEKNPPGTKVIIATMPGHPRLFVIAPGGMVPQRDLTGIWSRWLWQTLALLAIYLPITAVVLWRRHRRRTI